MYVFHHKTSQIYSDRIRNHIRLSTKSRKSFSRLSQIELNGKILTEKLWYCIEYKCNDEMEIIVTVICYCGAY